MSPVLMCSVRAYRLAAGLSQSALARRVGVSRQSLAAIEAGRSAPSTTLALGLARVLGCRVEDLFSLPREGLPARVGSGAPAGRAVVGCVGGRWVAHGLDAGSAVPADAIWDGAGVLHPIRPESELSDRALVAGCAPVLGPLCGHGVATWLYAPSGRALSWLSAGLIHIAGLHLAPHGDPGVHDRLLRGAMPDDDVLVFTLVGWRQGLVTAPGNPLGITGPADLARPGLRVARRQPGSGAAAVLSSALVSAGLSASADLSGPEAASHQGCAQAIRLGAADVAVVIEPVASAAGLPFVPLSEERFELALRRSSLGHVGVARVIERLLGASYAREVSEMRGYDLGQVGVQRVVCP